MKDFTVKKYLNIFREAITYILLLLPALFICLPVFILLSGSFMGSGELQKYLLPIFTGTSDFVGWRLMPEYPTFEHYKKLLFFTPQFFILFWNSIKIVGCILMGQILVGVPAAFSFAAYRGRGSSALFSFYVVLMLLPFQVTMLSTYLVLHRLNLLNTHSALILPAVFSTFPVFLTYGAFRAIPEQLFEAARIDGAGEFSIFVYLGLPLGKGGLMSAIVLGFLEYWNMMEQPMAFLSDKALWPLSLYLPEISWSQAGSAFCASIITLIPAGFVFIAGQGYLEQGIIYSGLKG